MAEMSRNPGPVDENVSTLHGNSWNLQDVLVGQGDAGASSRKKVPCWVMVVAANSFPQAAGPTVLLRSPAVRARLPPTPYLFYLPPFSRYLCPPQGKLPKTKGVPPPRPSQAPSHQCFLATQWEEIP